MKRIIAILNSFMLIGMIGMAISGLTGFNPFATTGAILGMASMAGPTISGALFSTPTTSVAEITKWAGMYSKTFLNQMLNGLDIMKDLSVDRMVSRHGKLLPKFTAQGGLRPLNTNIEENGASERAWSGRKLYVYDAMKLFKFVPEELVESFLSDMLAPGAKEIPFAQWVWMREMEKLASEINDNCYLADYAGDATAFDAAAAYTYDAAAPIYKVFGATEDIYKLLATTTAGQSPTTHPAKWQKVNQLAIATGLGTIIKNEIAGSTLTPIATGAISSSNAMDKFEVMYNGMTLAHRKKGGVVRMSSDVMRKYLLHERSVFANTAIAEDADGKKYIWGSGKKWELRECSWMGSSQRIIMTQFENLNVGTNLSTTPGITKTVETLHGYKAVAKFLLGFEISDLENLYVNDQA